MGREDVGDMPDRGIIEAFFAAEIIGNRREVDLGLVRQHPGGGGTETVFRKNFDTGLDQAFAGIRWGLLVCHTDVLSFDWWAEINSYECISQPYELICLEKVFFCAPISGGRIFT